MRISARARRDLVGIWIHSAQEWGPARAIEYVAGLDAGFMLILDHSRMGVAVDRYRQRQRRWGYGSHHIYYRLVGREVLIVRILHQRMDAARQFR